MHELVAAPALPTVLDPSEGVAGGGALGDAASGVVVVGGGDEGGQSALVLGVGEAALGSSEESRESRVSTQARRRAMAESKEDDGTYFQP